MLNRNIYGIARVFKAAAKSGTPALSSIYYLLNLTPHHLRCLPHRRRAGGRIPDLTDILTGVRA